MSLDRLKQEEAEMEAKYYSKATEGDLEAGPSNSPAETTFDLEPEVTGDLAKDSSETTTQETEEQTEQPEKTPRSNWKKRYTNFKASADTTIYQLRGENATLQEESVSLRRSIADLQDQLRGLQPSPYAGVITQEDEDTIGPDAVRIMQKTSEAYSKPLQEELDRLRKDKLDSQAKAAETARREASTSFRSKIESLVDDFDSVDTNPKFIKYLAETDPLTGHPRKQFFDKAVAYGDFVRTAGFYNDFVKSLPKSKEDILSSKVSPVGGGATPTGDRGRPKTYSMKEYNETYATYNKGGFQSKEEKLNLIKKMDLLDLAFSEGRIT